MEHAQELQINTKFQMFVANAKTCIDLPNTIEAQLGLQNQLWKDDGMLIWSIYIDIYNIIMSIVTNLLQHECSC